MALVLYFFGNETTFQAPGADFHGFCCALNLGLYFNQIGLPGAPGMIIGMAYLVTAYCVFSAYCASP